MEPPKVATINIWDDRIDMNLLLQKYSAIQLRSERNLIKIDLPEPPPREEFSHIDSIMPTRQRVFSPPLQLQRNCFMYEAIREISRKQSVTKIAILGCGELSFEKYAMNMISDAKVEHIVSVDTDSTSLSKGVYTLDRIIDENHLFAKRNALPIHVEVYKGDILHPCRVLSDVDVCCSTEVIEHMPEEAATALLTTVLTQIRPKAYILSTPNHEYNGVWGMPGKFRHDDHYFEFNREQFKEWLAKNVHPPYTYEISYVGKLLDYIHLDGATQFAVIRREGDESGVKIEGEEVYEKVGDFVYHNSWGRVAECIMVDAVKEYLKTFPFNEKDLQSIGTVSFWRIPVSEVLKCGTLCKEICVTEDETMLKLTSLFPSMFFCSQMPETKAAAVAIPSKISREDALNGIGHLFE